MWTCLPSRQWFVVATETFSYPGLFGLCRSVWSSIICSRRWRNQHQGGLWFSYNFSKETEKRRHFCDALKRAPCFTSTLENETIVSYMQLSIMCHPGKRGTRFGMTFPQHMGGKAIVSEIPLAWSVARKWMYCSSLHCRNEEYIYWYPAMCCFHEQRASTPFFFHVHPAFFSVLTIVGFLLHPT